MQFLQQQWWRLKSLVYNAMSLVSYWRFGRAICLLHRDLYRQSLLGTWEDGVVVLAVAFILFRHCGESLIVKVVQWRWATILTSTLIVFPNLLWSLLNIFNGFVSNKSYREGRGGEEEEKKRRSRRKRNIFDVPYSFFSILVVSEKVPGWIMYSYDPQIFPF